MRKRGKSFFFVFISIWIAITVGAFTPPVILNDSVYGIFRIAILAVMAFIVVAFSSLNAVKNNRFIKWYLAIVVVVAIMLFAFKALGFKVSYSDVTLLLFTFLSVCIGYSSGFERHHIESMAFIYGVLTVVLGTFTLIRFAGAIRLTDYMYAVDTKNMVGQLVATGGIGLTIITFANKNYRWLKVGILVFSIILVLLLRCRTAIVAFILFGAFYTKRAFHSSVLIVLAFIVVLVLIFFSSQIISFFDSILVGQFDVTDMESLSAGRMHRNTDGLAYFLEHPLFGEMGSPSDLANIHNYMIKRLAAYGIFSFPFQAFYLFFSVKVLKEWFKGDVKDINNVGSYMLIIPFFASLLEPLSPFGPGLVQIIPFFFYGCYIRSVDKSRYISLTVQKG